MKILIVDDEPLVQAGIKSMINWAEHGHEIAGTASNGEIAYKMIEDLHPDIVITDIKMPVMSGLELVSKCYEEKRELPVFILLTSYEELQYYKEAIKYQVLEYMVKLELTPESLLAAVEKAALKVESYKKISNDYDGMDNMSLMREKFLIRLILNLLDDSDYVDTLLDTYQLDFSSPCHTASYLTINGVRSDLAPDRQLALYTSSIQMVRELLCKYVPCEIISLDIRYFSVIFHTKAFADGAKATIENALANVSQMLYSYYGVTLVGGIGSPATTPSGLGSSYQDAKRVFEKATQSSEIIFYSDEQPDVSSRNIFNMSLFKDDLQTAFTEYNGEALVEVFDELTGLFKDSPSHYLQAVDAAGSILYMSLTFLYNGEQVVSDIFSDNKSGYKSLYESTSTAEVIEWMDQLKNGLCRYFEEHNRDFKSHLVTSVQKYIRENNTKRLSLNDVAKLFNISPSYLSILFSKYSDMGFSDYINQCKIDTAKKMLEEGELKIYEIADELGFESTSYFSRVFKKMTGLSPRDYLNQIS